MYKTNVALIYMKIKLNTQRKNNRTVNIQKREKKGKNTNRINITKPEKITQCISDVEHN